MMDELDMTVIDFRLRRQQALQSLKAEIETLKAVLGALASGSQHRDKVERLLKKLRLKAARLSIPVVNREAVKVRDRRKMN